MNKGLEELKVNLKGVTNFIEEMLKSSSGNYKLEIIKKHKDNPFLKKVFFYTYNHYKKYGVHSRNLKKHSDLVAPENFYDDLFHLLDDLAENNLTGHSAIQAVNAFIKELPEDLHDIIYSILDRDLRMGASITSVTKVHPNLLPSFKVALAHPYSPDRVNFETEEWLGSRKLDGVRCICRKEGNQISFFSRNGKEFDTLTNIADEVRKIPGNFVLDGEVCMVDDQGREDFQGIIKEIRRKDHTIKNPKFLVFDCIELDEFDNAKGTAKLSDRLNRVPMEYIKSSNNFSMLSAVEQVMIESEDQFSEMVKNAEELGYEGIMIRKNVSYEGKRSHNLLKVKKFYDDEYVITGCINGKMRWTEGGKQVEKEVLRNIIIEHKGYPVSVGSGLSKEQREYYLNRHEELIGKTVTIQYFEESSNLSGGLSLRFPVVKHIYKNGRDC